MYKLNQNGVIRLADGAFIPSDLANSDWLVFKEWEKAGNTPLPQDPSPPPTQDEIDATVARSYGKLIALKNMTPAQVQTWIDANITTLADARDALKTLAIAVGILARRI